MGVYTITVREIIEETYEELHPGQTIDMHDDDAVIATAKACIFDRAVERIKPEFRDVFVLGFSRMFANREIGTPDEDQFVFNVGADIITNADYINAMYEAAAIGLFGARSEAETEGTSRKTDEGTVTTLDSDNRVIDFETERDTVETGSSTGKTTDSGNDIVTANDDLVRTGNRNSANTASGSDIVTSDDTLSRDADRTSTTTASGTDTVTRNLNTAVDGTTGDTTTNSGTDTTEFGRKDQRSGAIADDYGTGLVTANSGSVVVGGSSLTTFPLARTSTNETTSRNIINEGPDNPIAGIDNDEYMSSASKNIQSSVSTEAGSELVGNNQTTEDTTRTTTSGRVEHPDTTATTASGEDKNIHGHVIVTSGETGSTTTDTGTIATLYGKKDTVVDNEESTETREGIVTTQHGKKDTLVETDGGTENREVVTDTAFGKVQDVIASDSKDTGVTGADKTTETGSRNGSTESTNTGVSNDSGTTKADAIDYLSIMQYGSLLDGVWVLFRFNFFSLY